MINLITFCYLGLLVTWLVDKPPDQSDRVLIGLIQGAQMQTTLDGATDEAGVENWKRAATKAMHPSQHQVAADVLAAIAAGLAAVTVPWELGEGGVPTERHYQRVLGTPEYEAWVICWPTGGSLDLHDHGGSAGAFTVVSGELEEATVEPTDDGSGSTTVVRKYTSGETSAFGSTRVHAIANRGTAPATSVHVYSPPLSSMVYYENDADNGLVAVAEETGGWM